MGQWVGSHHITKNLINLELIKIIQFFLKICDLLRHPNLWVGVWVVGWNGGLIDRSMGRGQAKSLKIKYILNILR